MLGFGVFGELVLGEDSSTENFSIEIQAETAELTGEYFTGMKSTAVLVAQQPMLSGEGGPIVSASGAIVSEAAIVESVARTAIIRGSGDLIAASAIIDGAGGQTFTATGALEASSAATDGEARGIVRGDGSLQAQGSDLDAVFTLPPANAANGELQTQSASIVGTARVVMRATGALQAGVASADGYAMIATRFSVELMSLPSTLDGEGGPSLSASGDLEAATSELNVSAEMYARRKLVNKIAA